MLNTKFAPWPCFTEEETEAVRHVLESNRVNYWTGGQGRDFEKEFAAFAKTRHAVALANGTLALDAALSARGHDLVLTERPGTYFTERAYRLIPIQGTVGLRAILDY